MNLARIRTFCWLTVCTLGLLAVAASSASAQGKFPIKETDIVVMKPIHYFLEDKKYREPGFQWEFTKETFTLEKASEPIPDPLLNQFLEKGQSATKITGKWKLVDHKLVLSAIKADDVDIEKEVTFELYKTAPTVIRWGSLPQFVFAANSFTRKP